MSRGRKGRWIPSLRTALLVVNLTILFLPLGSVTFFRIYESEMIRQKESALHAQGAYLAAMFRREMLGRAVERSGTGGSSAVSGNAIGPAWRHGANPALPYWPDLPSLSLERAKVRAPHGLKRFAGEPVGAAVTLAGGEMLPILLQGQAGGLDRVWITDHGGTVVASTLGEEGRLLLPWEEVQRALVGEHVSLLRRRSAQGASPGPLARLLLGTPMDVFVAKPVIEGDRVLGAVVLAGPPSRISEMIYGNQGNLLTALALLLIIVILISVFSSLMISEPIQAVIRQSEAVSRGDAAGQRSVRWPVLAEVGQLSDAIARMAVAIEERSRYITGFARSVSHEFKTPLTAIAGAVELLREHGDEMAPEDRRRFLGNLSGDAARLSALVSRLLDFARAEVAAPTADPVPVTTALESVVARFKAEGMAVAFETTAPEISVRIARELLESVLGNLLENVRRHCPPGTEVSVLVRRSAGAHGEGRFDLVVTDRGPGISPDNLAKVTRPFFTTARHSGGTGLGLSIVEALAHAHQGWVEIESPPGRGTRVTVCLPCAG